MKPGTEDRIQALTTLRQEFVDWTIQSLERLAYDLGEQGWTARQIADELEVPRTSVAKMAGAYAARTGRLSPFPTTRSYSGAVDISRLVSRELRDRESDPLQESEGTTHPTA